MRTQQAVILVGPAFYRSCVFSRSGGDPVGVLTPHFLAVWGPSVHGPPTFSAMLLYNGL